MGLRNYPRVGVKMRVTLNGQRLAPSVGNGAIHSGAKPTVKLIASPEVVWNGNPYCEPGTVLYLPGYPGSGNTIYDFSGQGNDGAITGAEWARNSRGLWYLDFDGVADHVIIAHDSSLSFAGDFSISVWFNRALGLAATDMLLTKGNGNDNFQNYELILLSTDGVQFVMGNVANDGLYLQHTSDVDAIAGWNHLAVSLSGTDSIMVLNGSTQTGGTASGTRTTNTDPVRIGEREDGFGDLTGGVTLVEFVAASQTAAQLAGRYQQQRHL